MIIIIVIILLAEKQAKISRPSKAKRTPDLPNVRPAKKLCHIKDLCHVVILFFVRRPRLERLKLEKISAYLFAGLPLHSERESEGTRSSCKNKKRSCRSVRIIHKRSVVSSSPRRGLDSPKSNAVCLAHPNRLPKDNNR